jgi:4-amino-4-deoxy-L-arabinose transferase-like glycosyltransferase
MNWLKTFQPDSFQGLLRLLILVALINFMGTISLPLFDEDEGEYAEVAVEMAASGNFISPTLNGQPFFEKPILAFWLQAPLVRLMGPQEWVFRAPSYLACLAWFWVILRFGRRHWGREQGALAAIFCATSLGVVVSAQAAAMDGVLCLLISLTCFDIYESWQRQSNARVWRVYLWMALGFLAKGPIAVLVPLLVSGLFYFLEGDVRRWLGAVFHPLGWLVFLAIASPWYLLQFQQQGWDFINYFLLRENLGRFTGSLQGHGGTLFYYFPVLLLIALPHTLRLLSSLRAGWQGRHHALTKFLLLWFAVVFVVFSLTGTKLPHYLLIGLTPLFLLMAQHSRNTAATAVLPLLLFPLVLAFLPAGIQYWTTSHSLNPYLLEMLGRGGEVFNNTWWFLWAVMSLCTLALLFLAWMHRGQWLPLAGILSNLWLVVLVLPTVAHLQQDPVIHAAHVARLMNQPVVADNRMPSFAVYSGQPTVHRTPHNGDVVFLRADEERSLPAHHILFSQGGLRLVKME